MNRIIVTLTGPSCSGKTSLLKKLKSTGNYTDIVSVTTREPRTGEVNGVDYYFVNEKQFKKLNMMEVIEFNGIKYGATVDEFENKFREGKVPVIVALPDGVRQIVEKSKDFNWQVASFYIDGNYEELHKRFLNRFIDEKYQENVSDYYAKRLTSLVNEKETLYSELCRCKPDCLYIKGYDTDNEEEVESLINMMVMKDNHG